jgi:hypothetical protein
MKFGRSMYLTASFAVVFSCFAGAAFVNYLSGTYVSMSTTISSPVEIQIMRDNAVTTWLNWDLGDGDAQEIPASGWQSDNMITFSNGHGGDIQEFWIKVHNLATGVITGHLTFDISCGDGLSWIDTTEATVSDFGTTAVEVYDWNHDSGSATDKRQIDIPDAFALFQTKKVGSHLRIWSEGGTYTESYLFPTGDDGDTYYVKISLAFASGALGEYTVKAAFLSDPEGAFPPST